MAGKAEDARVSRAIIKAIGERLKVYLEAEWRGNQSALGKAVRVSQPAISRVTAGEQLPSGKLLWALRKHTNISLDWLLEERGAMLVDVTSTTPRGGGILPVADRPLPGGPNEHPDLLTGEYLPSFGPTRLSQYWLRVAAGDPITRAAGQMIKAGDLILLDAGDDILGTAAEIYEQLWLIRLQSPAGSLYRLAEVSHVASDRYEADTFDLQQEPRAQQVIELRPLPGGRFAGSTRPRPKKGARPSARKPPDLPRWPHRISEEDLIARKVVILRK